MSVSRPSDRQVGHMVLRRRGDWLRAGAPQPQSKLDKKNENEKFKSSPEDTQDVSRSLFTSLKFFKETKRNPLENNVVYTRTQNEVFRKKKRILVAFVSCLMGRFKFF